MLTNVNAYILCSDKISAGCLDYNKYYRYKFLSRRTRAVIKYYYFKAPLILIKINCKIV